MLTLWKSLKHRVYITFMGEESRNKIIFIACAGVVFFAASIYCEHQFNNALNEAARIDPVSWETPYENNKVKDKYKIVFITSDGGEYSYAEYFKYEAEKLGWEVKIYYNNALTHEGEILDFNPDFILSFIFSNPHYSIKLRSHKSKKYLVNFASFQRMRNADDSDAISKINPYQPLGSLKIYIDSVHGVLSSAKELDIYKRMFDDINKPFNGIRLLPLIPEVHNTAAQPRTLMWASCAWGGHRATQNYKRFIKLLSENVPMKVYGSHNASAYITSGTYDGMIAPGIDNIDTIRENGIYLLTHGDWHFAGREISMRGFEAAAAGAVVISDKLPFIVEHFGDSFLYFDHDADAQTMYEQVKAHMDWIKQNPDAAKAMAEKAHKIYLEKFTLKNDLIRIVKMHEGVLAQEKAMDLSHPLAY